MRLPALAFLLIAVSAFSSAPAAETDFSLPIDGQVRMVMSLSKDVFNPVPVEGSDFLWIAIAGGEGQKFGLQDGVYVFDEPGVFFLHQPIESCASVILAPGGEVIVLGTDTPVARQWRFFSFPFMSELGAVVCPPESPGLTWVQDIGAVYTTLEGGDYGRQGAEPCEPRSVAYFDFATNAERILLRGTDRYDYRVKDLVGLEVSAERAVAPNSEPVPGLDDMSPLQVTAILPPGDCPELPMHFALAVEGRFSGLNSGDGILTVIEMFPSALEYSESNYVSLNLEESEHFSAFMSMQPEDRVRVVYDMMQQWDARAGKRVVSAVVRSVEQMPDYDPKG